MSELVEKLQEYVEGRVKTILENLKFVEQVKKDVRFLVNCVEAGEFLNDFARKEVDEIKKRYYINKKCSLSFAEFPSKTKRK